MHYRFHTLVDITNTQARKGEDPILYREQQNYMTFTQTLGLRTTFIDFHVSVKDEQDLAEYKFGNKFKGKATVWTGTFKNDREEDLELGLIEKDFDIVPIITGLKESVELEIPAFRSQIDANRNIYFEIDDK